MESDERHIRIWRNNDEIFSGETSNPMEHLRVSVRWVIELLRLKTDFMYEKIITPSHYVF